MPSLTARFVEIARKQVGKPYVFGAEAAPNDPDPPAFDCSELVEWACARVGVAFPDGTWNQIAACKRIAVADAATIIAGRLGAHRPAAGSPHAAPPRGEARWSRPRAKPTG